MDPKVQAILDRSKVRRENLNVALSGKEVGDDVEANDELSIQRKRKPLNQLGNDDSGACGDVIIEPVTNIDRTSPVVKRRSVDSIGASSPASKDKSTVDADSNPRRCSLYPMEDLATLATSEIPDVFVQSVMVPHKNDHTPIQTSDECHTVVMVDSDINSTLDPLPGSKASIKSRFAKLAETLQTFDNDREDRTPNVVTARQSVGVSIESTSRHSRIKTVTTNSNIGSPVFSSPSNPHQFIASPIKTNPNYSNSAPRQHSERSAADSHVKSTTVVDTSVNSRIEPTLSLDQLESLASEAVADDGILLTPVHSHNAPPIITPTVSSAVKRVQFREKLVDSPKLTYSPSGRAVPNMAVEAGSDDQASSVLALAKQWETKIQKSDVASAAFLGAKALVKTPAPRPLSMGLEEILGSAMTPKVPGRSRPGQSSAFRNVPAGGVTSLSAKFGTPKTASTKHEIDSSPQDLQSIRKQWENLTSNNRPTPVLDSKSRNRHSVYTPQKLEKVVERPKSVGDLPEFGLTSVTELSNQEPEQPEQSQCDDIEEDIENQVPAEQLEDTAPIPFADDDDGVEISLDDLEEDSVDSCDDETVVPPPTETAISNVEEEPVDQVTSDINEDNQQEDDPLNTSATLADELNTFFEESLRDTQKVHEAAKPKANPALSYSLTQYRRNQKNQSAANSANGISVVVKPPVNTSKSRTLKRQFSVIEADAIRSKLKTLNGNVNVQQALVSQLGRFVTVCRVTDEFNGSTEEVEAEKHLLLAIQKRTCLYREIDDLAEKLRNDLPVPNKSFGTLSVSDIRVTLKREFINTIASRDYPNIHNFVCILSHQDQVVATELISSEDLLKSDSLSSGQIEFSNMIQMKNLEPNFVIKLEVFGLQTRQEQFSHNEKYRINMGNKGKEKTMNVRPPVVPSAMSPEVKTNFFSLGTCRLSMETISKKRFLLDQVQFSSPIENSLYVSARCEALPVEVEQRGFMNIYQEIGGSGAWKRLWCLLDGKIIRYWNYPDDEPNKDPMGTIDLTECLNESIYFVTSDVCHRPHTILLEMKYGSRSDGRPRIANCMISFDTKQDAEMWQSQLNISINSVRMWSSGNDRQRSSSQASKAYEEGNSAV